MSINRSSTEMRHVPIKQETLAIKWIIEELRYYHESQYLMHFTSSKGAQLMRFDITGIGLRTIPCIIKPGRILLNHQCYGRSAARNNMNGGHFVKLPFKGNQLNKQTNK